MAKPPAPRSRKGAAAEDVSDADWAALDAEDEAAPAVEEAADDFAEEDETLPGVGVDGEIMDPEAEIPDGRSEEAEEALKAAVQAILGRLQQEADDRVGKRHVIEQRWIEDLLQFHGKYDEKTRKALASEEKSGLFINKSRPVTNAMSARLMDLLFPTDDRNWGILPSPVPELAFQNERAQSQAVEAEIEANALSAEAEKNVDAAPKAAAAQLKAGFFRQAADKLSALMTEARAAADLMQAEIEDHLKACDYQAACRDVVEDACKIGTGVMKGPITGLKAPSRWVKGPDGQYALAPQSTTRPAMVWIDPWSFFPDPEVSKIQDSEGDYIRHLMNKRALRALARLPGFDKDAIRTLLTGNPRGTMPSYLNELRSIHGDNAHTDAETYQVWEYTGALTPEEMRDLAIAAGDLDTAEEMAEVDPLDEVRAVIWFCQGELLSFNIYPMDSGETLFSVYNLEKDSTSVFGYGVPYLLRDPQKALNAAWRMMMDNSSASVGSQIMVNPEVIEPENGRWELAARKIWRLKANLQQNVRAFDVFDVPNHQAEFANIIQIAKQNMDEEASMPAIAQGEQGAEVTKTAGGMALLMNSSNVVFRRFVKNFDDDLTTPNIRRMYHHEMQHSAKQEIKGDYEVDARGSSVLLAREMQSQNLIAMADRFAGHPVFGKMLKPADLLRAIVSSHMIAADTLVKSDAEIQEAEAAEAEALAAQAPVGVDPEIEKRKLELMEDELDARVAIAEADRESKLEIARLEHEWKMATLAERMNTDEQSAAIKLQDGREARRSKERTVAAEIAAAQRQVGRNGPEIANL